MTSLTRFKIKSLKLTNVVKAIEAISVMIFAFFATALLPSLIFRFFFADANLLEQPKVFEYIPIAAFAIGTAYFLYAMIGNFIRSRKIRQLEAQLEIETMSCGDTTDLKKLEEMASKKVSQAKKAVKKPKAAKKK